MVIGLVRMAFSAAGKGALSYGQEAGMQMASKVGATEGTGDDRKLKEGIINGPKGVLTRLKDGAKMASKMTGVTASISAMLKQSQIFTGVVGSIFQIIGALIDILLMPLVPVFMPIVKGLAKITELALLANNKGFMPGLLLIPVIGKFLFAAHSATIAADYVSNWLQTVNWGEIGKSVLNQARWPSAGIFGGGGLIFGSGLPAPIELEKFLRQEQKGLRAGAVAARLKYDDSFELRGTTEVLTKETVAGQFGNDRRVLDADSLRRGVEAIYQNGEKARVYHVEREEEMLDMDFAYS